MTVFAEDDLQLSGKVRRSSTHRYTALEQKASHLVHDGGSSCYPTIAHPVQSLEIQLLIGLDRNKTHRRPLHGFRDRLRVQVSFLLVLT